MTKAPLVRPGITGTTRLYAVVGDPIEQVQAPALLNALFCRLGTDAVLIPVNARPQDFSKIMQGLQRTRNLDGILITIPHKAAACWFASELRPMAAIAGSTNAMRRDDDGRWIADNFDGSGFVRGLESAGNSPRGKRVSLVGGGGAGSAIAAALLAAGTAHLWVCDQDTSKLAALLERLEERWPGRVTGCPAPDMLTADIAVNATALGLRPDDPLPFSLRALPPGALVADIIMKPRETALLKAAAALGHPVHHGMHMLEEQVDCYRDFFRLDCPSAGTRTRG
jgi:shikimate dehydrogenase